MSQDDGDAAKKYNFQLQQVRNKLAEDPHDQKLQALEQKLLRLLEFTQEARKDQVEKVEHVDQGGTSYRAVLRRGGKCQVRIDSTWKEAVVLSFGSNKATCTVVLSTTGETCHSALKDIRPFPLPRTTDQPIGSHKIPTREKRPTVDAKAPYSGSRKQGTRRSEHKKKKDGNDNEHAERQQSWKAFSQKAGVGIKR